MSRRTAQAVITGTIAATGQLAEERKFRFGRKQAKAVLGRLEPWLNEDCPDPSLRLAQVRTTYLDSQAWRRLHPSGHAAFHHVRVREYVAAASTPRQPRREIHQCFLEYKWSCERMRTKLRVPASPEMIRELLHGGQAATAVAFGSLGFDQAALAFLTRLVQAFRLRPCMTVHYQRTSWTGERGLRITLDQDIRFCRPVEIGAPDAVADVVAALRDCVLEVKRTAELPAGLALVLADLPEAHAFSKFRAGMKALAENRQSPEDRRRGAAHVGGV